MNASIILRRGGAAILAAALAAALPAGCRKTSDIARPFKGSPGEQASAGGESTRLEPQSPSGSEESFTDPFCGLRLRKNEAAGTFEYKGVTYYFCTTDHLKAFKEDPEKYLDVDTEDEK